MPIKLSIDDELLTKGLFKKHIPSVGAFIGSNQVIPCAKRWKRQRLTSNFSPLD